MAAVFAAPVLAAWFFYYNPQYLPAARSNKGELITPMVALGPDSGLANPDGSPFELSSLQGKWTLVSLNRPPCGEQCRKRLAALRQIRLALGESRFSVERMQILAGTGDTATLARDFAGMHISLARGTARDKLLNALGESFERYRYRGVQGWHDPAGVQRGEGNALSAEEVDALLALLEFF